MDELVLLKAELYDVLKAKQESDKFTMMLAEIMGVAPDEHNRISYEELLDNARALANQVYGIRDARELDKNPKE